MSRLIIVAGPSGAGKTFIHTQLSSYRNDILPIKKLTTRPPRNEEPKSESIDLIFNCETENVKNCKYTYQYYGNNYGINKKDIDSALMKNINPIVIVANCNTIEKMKKDYKDALVLYIQTGLSGNDLKQQLLKYRDPVDIDSRMKRQKEGYNDYLRHIGKHIFDYTLINYFDDTFIQQLDFVLDEELKHSQDKNYIFVIMSFDSKYDDVYESIKLAGQIVSNNKLRIERVSEPKGDYIITERIERSIKKAGLIICDVSEKSPNVYYELGYARARNKTIIMTAKDNTELPFDVRQYRTNFYSSPTKLQKIIVEELTNYYN